MMKINKVFIITVMIVVGELYGTGSDSCNATCQFRDGRDGRDGKDGRDGISIQGPSGNDGVNGRDGKDCVECARGPMGPKGQKGNSGAKGDRGPPGVTGSRGNIGASGVNGLKGDPGVAGKKGNTGSKGDKGDKGDQGVCNQKVLDKILKDIQTLQKENAELKRQAVKLQANNKIKQSVLPGGYDSYSVYDLQWQSLHMAAAAACRGSTASGGSGRNANYVYSRAGDVSCTSVCGKTQSKYCDAEVSIYGFMKKATKAESIVGVYYNYGCGLSRSDLVEDKVHNEYIVNGFYVSYCCCRE